MPDHDPRIKAIEKIIRKGEIRHDKIKPDLERIGILYEKLPRTSRGIPYRFWSDEPLPEPERPQPEGLDLGFPNRRGEEGGDYIFM